MSRLLFLLLCSGFALGALTAPPSPEPPIRPAREVSARAGLPNFFTKAQTPGAELKVAYLGGSITAQPGWRVKSLKLMQATFPNAKFTEINAALGGTGSDLGVFRVESEVLNIGPDLLFVEFAVNDGGADPSRILKGMEGIVRKTWKAHPNCDICFVYTVTEALVPPMLEGNFPRAVCAMEMLADHYQIPTIHMGMEVARMAKEGILLWKAKLPSNDLEKAEVQGKFVFAPDSVHPHVETGHQLYLEAIQRSLPVIQNASSKAIAHREITPLSPDNYEMAKMVSMPATAISAGIQKLSDDHALTKRFPRLSPLFAGSKSGESVSFKFKGTRASLYQLIGPDVGQVRVSVDGETPKTVTIFDSYCSSHRISTLSLCSELPDTVHSVRIEIDPATPDKAAILAKRNVKIEKPEQYDGTFFYPSKLLLIGELVD
jgi:hypothetical protein